MGLLAQRIAADQPLGGETRAFLVPGIEPLSRDHGEGILEAIRESLALPGETVVPEPFGEIPAVLRNGCLGRAERVVRARLEARHVERAECIGPKPERLGVCLEDRIQIQAGRGERGPQLIERLAERARGGAERFRPQVGGDRLTRARPAGQCEQGEERLRMAADDADLTPIGPSG